MLGLGKTKCNVSLRAHVPSHVLYQIMKTPESAGEEEANGKPYAFGIS